MATTTGRRESVRDARWPSLPKPGWRGFLAPDGTGMRWLISVKFNRTSHSLFPFAKQPSD